METKHTKGEWESKEIFTDTGSYFKVISGGISICNIITRNMEEAEYNAKLIAASPEMLESLKEAKYALEWYMENTKPIENDWQTFHDLGMNVRVKSEEIITKATEL